MTKKVVKKEKEKGVDLSKLSFVDLYQMYLFVGGDLQSVGFARTSTENKRLISDRHKEIEEELFRRAYGKNPFSKEKIIVGGMKPEDIDLDRFVIAKDK